MCKELKKKVKVARAAEDSMRNTYNDQQHKLKNTEYEQELNEGSGRRAYYHHELDMKIGDAGSTSS